MLLIGWLKMVIIWVGWKKLDWPFRAEEEGNRVSQSEEKLRKLTVLPTHLLALKMEKVIPKTRSADSL
jgi:hypothetical protein